LAAALNQLLWTGPTYDWDSGGGVDTQADATVQYFTGPIGADLSAYDAAAAASFTIDGQAQDAGPCAITVHDMTNSTTFYENGWPVKTESSQWLPAWKRLILLSAAHCLNDPGRSEHGYRKPRWHILRE